MRGGRSITLVVLVLCTISPVVLLQVSPADLALRYFRSDGLSSDYIYVPQQISENPEFLGIDVLVVGGSSTREFFPGGKSLSAYFSNVCGRQVTAFNGSTSSQGLSDSAAVADAVYAAGSAPSIIVVGITNNRLAHDWQTWNDVLIGQTLALPAAPTILRMLGFLDRARWYAADWGGQLSRSAVLVSAGKFSWHPEPPEVGERHFYERDPLSIAQKRQKTFLAAVFTDQGLSDPSRSAEFFGEVFATYRDRGATIIFLMTPVSGASAAVRSYQNEAIDEAKAVLAHYGRVVDLASDRSLPEVAFFDEQHLRPEGRDLIWLDPSSPLNISHDICSAL
jgi:hypothetical protein